jgi:Mrp family chromosome partitioning ATPase
MPPTGTYSRAALATRRFRFIPRAAWLGARARNVLQRPLRLLVIGTAVFVGVLLSYLFLPAGAQGVLNLLRPDRIEWRDTTLLLTRESAARARLASADSSLASLRATRAALVAAMSPPVATAEQSAAGDSIATRAAALSALLQRAESAPLPETFRALANTPVLRGDPRVRALLDSLNDVERERDDLGAGATVDPVFVALTTQANELGRRIIIVGQSRLAALTREQLALVTPVAPTAADSAAVTLPDSQATLAVRRSAWVAYEAARRTLTNARAANARADSVASRERARNQLAPIPILVAGALIIAAAVTFALAMFDEMRSPRVADAVEAERLTSLRVLGVARLRALPAERSRRAADRQVPALLDPTFDAYRVLAWHLSSQWPKDGIVTVTGDNSTVAAAVAANLAAVLANDARVTLLVDADLAEEPVRALFSLPRSPGLVAVVENRRKWSEVLVPVPVGRGRTMDVLPAGGREAPLGPAESQALVTEVQRAARRHDATIVVTTLAGAKRFRAGDDVVVCATQTRTRLATLARTVASMIDEGARVRGVVLWDGPLPAAPKAPRSAPAPAAA